MCCDYFVFPHSTIHHLSYNYLMSNTLHLLVQIRTEPTREPYNWRQKESRQDMGLGSLNRRSTYCLRANRTPQLGRVMKTFYNTSISSQDHKEISTATHSSNRRDSIWNYNERVCVCVCNIYVKQPLDQFYLWKRSYSDSSGFECSLVREWFDFVLTELVRLFYCYVPCLICSCRSAESVNIDLM